MPHIYFKNGWWRVSLAPKGHGRKHYEPWNLAHKTVGRWNLGHSSTERLQAPWNDDSN